MGISASKYLYYRGFYITDKEFLLPNFNEYRLDGNYYLYLHCEQRIVHFDSGKIKIWVIGTFFNIDGLKLEDAVDFDAISSVLYNTCGRYVIVALKEGDLRIYGDPSNSMSYCFSNGVVASSPSLCGMIAGKNDKSFMAEAYKKFGLVRTMGYITNETSIQGVYWGIPNFYLEFSNMELKRFFPQKTNPYVGLSLKECISEIKRNVESQIAYLHSIYDDVVMEITGGVDSRFVLALAKKYARYVKFYTYNLGNVFNDDVAYAEKIAKSYKLNNVVYRLNYDDYLGYNEFESFQNVMSKNNDIPQHVRPLAYLLNRMYHESNAVRVYSRISEVGRAYLQECDDVGQLRAAYADMLPANKSNKDVLHELFTHQDNEFARRVSEFMEILDYDSTKKLGYDELDMFYNERRMGMWNGPTCIDFEYAFKNSISVFNNRKILDLLLSRPYAERVESNIYHAVLDADPVIGADKYERISHRLRTLGERKCLSEAVLLADKSGILKEKPYLAYRELARAHYCKAKYEQAVKYMDMAIAANPNYNKNPWFVREKACYMYANMDYKGCIDYIMAIKSLVAPDYVMLAMSCAEINYTDEACQYAKRCFELDYSSLLLQHGYPEEEVIWKKLFDILLLNGESIVLYRKKYGEYLRSRGITNFPIWYKNLFDLK